jgi:demethylmenaquinone methyltransferase/2-methoxy-6-polyprenyl-1,4-benzoquinol methylase
MGEAFYRRGVGGVSLRKDMRALDLGCGPGGISFALAGTAHPEARIIGIDISEDQIAYARSRADGFDCRPEFRNMSMDRLDFADAHFDVVTASMSIHETPPGIRRAALSEVARVLKPGGTFILVEWSRPRLGLLGILWYPMVRFGEKNRDNWHNVYPDLCRDRGLTLTSDDYLNSISRRQTFRK